MCAHYMILKVFLAVVVILDQLVRGAHLLFSCLISPQFGSKVKEIIFV